MVVRVLPNSIEFTEIVNEHLVHQQYIGYSMSEAKSDFKRLVAKQKKATHTQS